MSVLSMSKNASSKYGCLGRKAGGSAHEIRSRLLNKLGIYDEEEEILHHTSRKDDDNTGALRRRQQAIMSGQRRRHQQRRPGSLPPSSTTHVRSPAVPFQVPLKYHDDHDDETTASASNKVGFADIVSVVAIPMRTAYSSRIKARLWSDRSEIHENVRRNTVEFAAEGWNWRNVTEDDGMFVCSVSGALIHPVHCRRFLHHQQLQQQRQRTPHTVSPRKPGSTSSSQSS